MSKITSIGGEALMEGVMMRGPHRVTAAFCDKDGNITTEDIHVTPLTQKYKVLSLPLIRGPFSFIDSLRIGSKALNLSAEKIGLDDGEEELTGFDKWLNDKFGDKIMGIITAVGSVLGVALAVVLFMLVPSLIFNGIKYIAGDGIEPARSLFEGALKFIVFIVYIWLMSKIPDIHRVFMYHGAEHKTIFCYENDLELTVENVKKMKRLHPRCGTSFLVLMIIIGIFVGFFIKVSNPFLRTILKILTLPVVMSLGYELIRYCGRHDNTLCHIVSAPGKWIQLLTTAEPDDKMMETAIAAIKAVIPENGEDIV